MSDLHHTPPGNMPTSTGVPSSRSVYSVIFLGIVGLLVSFAYLLYDCKQSIPAKYSIAITDTGGKHIDTIYAEISSNLKADSASLMGSPTLKELAYSKIFFHINASFLVWISFFSIMMAFSLAMLPVFWYAINQLTNTFKTGSRTKLMIGLYTFTILAALLLINVYHPYYLSAFESIEKLEILLKNPQVLNYFVVLVQIIAMLPVYGQLIINHSIDNIRTDDIRKAVEEFTLLRQRLKFFLISLAAFVVFSILTSDALRRAMSTEVRLNIDLFPSNFVYLYGLTFTFFLALLYLPIYFRLSSARERLANALERNSTAENDKEQLIKALRMEETPLQNIEIALSILSPVITSLLPNLVTE